MGTKSEARETDRSLRFLASNSTTSDEGTQLAPRYDASSHSEGDPR